MKYFTDGLDNFCIFVKTENMKIINKTNQLLNRVGGIYAIYFEGDNELYIGSTRQHFRARLSNHLKFLRMGKSSNKKMIRKFRELGEDKMIFRVLEICQPSACQSREQAWIKRTKPTLNFQKVAVNKSLTNLGRKFTQEHIDKLREKSKVYRHSDDIKLKLGALNKENSSKYQLTNLTTNEVLLFDSAKKVSEYFGISWFPGHTDVYKNHRIENLKRQRQSISILIDDQWETFISLEKCDKRLNKWRGFTSSKLLLGDTVICGYPVKIN